MRKLLFLSLFSVGAWGQITTFPTSSGGGGSPGGSANQIQFNNGASFGGTSGETCTATTCTLVTPSITQINDGNGNPFITSAAVASTVDAVTITGAATANPAAVQIAVTGSDTNVDLNIKSKGVNRFVNFVGSGSTVGVRIEDENPGSILQLVDTVGQFANSASTWQINGSTTSSGIFATLSTVSPTIGWSSANTYFGGSVDTGLGRTAAGIVSVGNGTSGNTLGGMKMQEIQFTGSHPTITGCGTPSTFTGGNTTGTFAALATSCTPVLTFAFTATTGWFCEANDLTTTTDTMHQTATTTTTATLTGTVVSADVINFHCVAY